MNTSAYFISHYATSASEALEMAAAIEHEIDQNWEDEATIFTFEDASVLAVSGPTVMAFENHAAALIKFPHTA